MNLERHPKSSASCGRIVASISAHQIGASRFGGCSPQFFACRPPFNTLRWEFENRCCDFPYDRLLVIQNAADLEYPATDPANAGTRDEFRLGLFPPHNATSHEPAPAPAPTEPPAK